MDYAKTGCTFPGSLWLTGLWRSRERDQNSVQSLNSNDVKRRVIEPARSRAPVFIALAHRLFRQLCPPSWRAAVKLRTAGGESAAGTARLEVIWITGSACVISTFNSVNVKSVAYCRDVCPNHPPSPPCLNNKVYMFKCEHKSLSDTILILGLPQSAFYLFLQKIIIIA